MSESLKVSFWRAALCGGRDTGGKHRYCSLDLQTEKTVMEPGLSNQVIRRLHIMKVNVLIDGSEEKIGMIHKLHRQDYQTVESFPASV